MTVYFHYTFMWYHQRFTIIYTPFVSDITHGYHRTKDLDFWADTPN